MFSCANEVGICEIFEAETQMKLDGLLIRNAFQQIETIFVGGMAKM